MTLISDWRETLLKAWSVRAAILVALLPVAESLLPQLHLPPFIYSALMIVIVVARVLSQK